MKKSLHPVSDHAVLRYLERVLGLDVEAVRREIGHKAALALEHPGACGVVVDGVTFKIRCGVITTVIHAHRADIRTGRIRRERPE